MNAVFADSFYWIALTEVLAFCSSDVALPKDPARAVGRILSAANNLVIPQSGDGFIAGLSLSEARPDKGLHLYGGHAPARNHGCNHQQPCGQEGLRASVLPKSPEFLKNSLTTTSTGTGTITRAFEDVFIYCQSTMLKRSINLFSIIALATGIVNASTLAGPSYPPPGGVTLGSSGSSGSGSGKTYTYSGFDNTAYSSLYWGPTSIANIRNSGDPGPTDMAFAGSSGNTYEFDSTTNWSFSSTQTGSVSLPSRMILTVTGLGAENTEANLGASATEPTYPLFAVTNTFSAQFVFQSFYGGSWTPVLDFQNSHNTPGNTVLTAASFGFFSAPAVPEPGTWTLFAAGSLLTGFLGRRIRRAAR